MPELPEVETTKRGIESHVVNKTIKSIVVRQHQLRWPILENLPELLSRKKVIGIDRRGKYLLLAFHSGTLIIHLGMSGSLRIVDLSEPAKKHDHVDIELASGKIIRFTDPRRFGAIVWTDKPVAEHKLLSHLGPEPLTDDFNNETLFTKSRKRKVPIKVFIMDSNTVVGVGNIYANEALFLTGIRPTRPAGKVTLAQYMLLTEKIKYVLAKAIKAGGTTLKDFIGGDGKPGYFQQELFVYGREGKPCLECGSILKQLRLGQRTTVYCPKCQK